jgi:hypothetical protein
VNELLGGVGLSEAARWADCAKGICDNHRPLTDEEQEFVEENPRHHSFHYTDVPIQQSEYRPKSAGTGRDDVVQIISHAFRVLKGTAPQNGPAVLNKRKSVWILAHLVGDIHQPLHVGSIYFDRQCDTVVDPNKAGVGKPNFSIGTLIGATTGGNDLLTGKSANLHHYWDANAVAAAMSAADKDTIEDYAQHLADNPPAGSATNGDPTTWSTQWATEILPLARQALRRIDFDEGEPGEDKDHMLKCTVPVTRKEGYGKWAAQQAHIQLAKAGFRLAAILREALRP